ncbi:MAG: hypothetical protein EA390_14935 [Balneolaceae bacterium]|nr:MAG: hypothetical protein EA390_14935 [Balneolaceae bacterium]
MNRLILLLLSFTLSSVIYAQSNDFTLHEGDIDGAPYKVVVPHQWVDGKVFFHVHGWRPADAPHEADLDLNDPFYRNLLEEGWVIGRTAFQENGVDHDAHTEELDKLKSWISERVGEIELLIMEGESTAGTLLLRIAERNPDLAEGVIAKGAFVELADETADSYLEANPQIPAVLMSNLTELDGPVAFTATAEFAPVPPSLRPLLRPGHVNVNWMERRDALYYLYAWIRDGAYSPFSDGTRNVPDRDTGTMVRNETIENRVASINPYFGNAILGFHPDELKESGIEQGHSFIFEVHGQQRNVFYGQSYGDVEHGEWVAFPTADDRILVARNHESAVEAANLSVGDVVRLKPLDN